jgi:hypothetical protein
VEAKMPRWLAAIFSLLIFLTACAPQVPGIPAGYEDNTALIESLEMNDFVYQEIECENPCRGYINRDLKLGAVAYKNGSGMFVMPLEDEDAVAIAFLLISDVYGTEVFEWLRDSLEKTAVETQETTINGYDLIFALDRGDGTDVDEYRFIFVAQPAK